MKSGPSTAPDSPPASPHDAPSRLPGPDAPALAHSARLQQCLLAQIAAQGGWISFAQYMEQVLYHPALGYYSGGATKFGAAGDFVTAPELSPLFGQTLAQPIARWLRQTSAHILEFGAGTGALAAQLLNTLGELDTAVEKYFILDLSGELRARQRQTLQQDAPQWLDRVHWLDRLPEDFTGVMLGNEVLDAMPVQLFSRQNNGWMERGVSSQDGQLVFAERAADDALRMQITALEQQLGHAFPDGYVSELCAAAPAFVSSAASALSRGVLLLIDYGFPAREYYHAQRSEGTLMCHYRHHAHSDPFLYPGLQDITAHVDFSSVAAAGEQAGLALLGYTSQARALINAGIADRAATLDRSDMAGYLPAARGLQTLLNESEMGELFKMIGFGKNIDAEEAAMPLFQQGNRQP
jgi:SAM-dependent MidA family methyltransferase